MVIKIRTFSLENSGVREDKNKMKKYLNILNEKIGGNSINITSENFLVLRDKGKIKDWLTLLYSTLRDKDSSLILTIYNERGLDWKRLAKIISKASSKLRAKFEYEKINDRLYPISFSIYVNPSLNKIYSFPKYPPRIKWNYYTTPPIHQIEKELIVSICYEFTNLMSIDMIYKKVSADMWIIPFYDNAYIHNRAYTEKNIEELYERDLYPIKNMVNGWEDIVILGVNYKNIFLAKPREVEIKAKKISGRNPLIFDLEIHKDT